MIPREAMSTRSATVMKHTGTDIQPISGYPIGPFQGCPSQVAPLCMPRSHVITHPHQYLINEGLNCILEVVVVGELKVWAMDLSLNI